ncbi:MAG: YihY/virulence factor BrkB family protein [Bacteroidales bacterium]|nr:YihY/virulence factor BrkB family protein [Bacteroidales bacterium]
MNKQAEQYWRKFLYWRPIRTMLHASRLLVLPGFQGVPLFDVLLFFIKGLTKGVLNQRSAALSFHFFLSLFPMILFLFTILPFLNLESYTEQILESVDAFLPESAFDYVSHTITDIISRKHRGLMSISIISSIYVASSAVNFLIITLNQSQHTQKKTKFLKRRLISIALVIGLSIGLIISIALILFSKKVIFYLIVNETIKTFFQYYVLKVLKWVIIIILIYLTFAIMYYVVPANKKGYRFFSAGATLGTVLFILMSQGFNLYITHFSRYNALYGSIGAMIIFLLWIYLNSYVLIIGFELNAAIADAYTHGLSTSAKNKYDLHISRTAKNIISVRTIKRSFNRLKTKLFHK